MGRLAWYLVCLFVSLSFTSESAAHDAKLTIDGKKLVVRSDKGPGKQKLLFVAKKQAFIGIQHDPAQTGSWLLVRGHGPEEQIAILVRSRSHALATLALLDRLKQDEPRLRY